MVQRLIACKSSRSAIERSTTEPHYVHNWAHSRDWTSDHSYTSSSGCAAATKRVQKSKPAIERSTTELHVQDKAHSRDWTSDHSNTTLFAWRCRGLNPGLCACKAHDLPLIYIPELMLAVEIFGLSQRQTRPGNSSETCSIELSTMELREMGHFHKNKSNQLF